MTMWIYKPCRSLGSTLLTLTQWWCWESPIFRKHSGVLEAGGGWIDFEKHCMQGKWRKKRKQQRRNSKGLKQLPCFVCHSESPHKAFAGPREANWGPRHCLSKFYWAASHCSFRPQSWVLIISKMIQKHLREPIYCYQYFHLSTLINTQQLN